MTNLRSSLICLLAVVFVLQSASFMSAQRARRGARQGPGMVSRVQWDDDGKTVRFTSQGQRYQFDLETLEKTELEDAEGGQRASDDENRPGPRFRGNRGNAGGNTGRYVGRPTRGRQYTQVDSPNGKWQALYKDWNLVLKNSETDEEVNVTSDGDEKIHYGTASWVYGEELGQSKAMWWTPDSKKILYYKFDDTLCRKILFDSRLVQDKYKAISGILQQGRRQQPDC